jgi:hypothetical protein
MIGRGDDGFAVYRQQLHHLVFIHNRRQDGIVVYLARGFIVGQHVLSIVKELPAYQPAQEWQTRC